MSEGKRSLPPNLYILRLSFIYFAVAMAVFVLTMVATVYMVQDFTLQQSLRGSHGRLLAHLFLLGFATMLAMGASFQLTQVILRTSLFSRTLGYVQLAAYVCGIALLAPGFISDSTWLAIGGCLVLLGVALYAFNIGMTFAGKKEWNVFVFGVSLSLLSLLMTIVMGLSMGFSFAYGWFANAYGASFSSHLWFGIAGWLSGLIIVYSFKLLSMFYVSRKKPSLDAYVILAGFHAGVWLRVAAAWLQMDMLTYAGSLCMLIALAWFVVYIWDVRKQSKGKTPVGAVRVAFYLIPATAFLFLVWNGVAWFTDISLPLLEALLIFIVIGTFSASILAYLSKILPFLWWAHRFRTKEEKKGAVLLSDMLPEQRLTWELVAYLLAVACVVTAYVLQAPTLAWAGQAVACCIVIVYAVELSRVFRY